MKKSWIIISSLILITLLFAACEQKAPEAKQESADLPDWQYVGYKIVHHMTAQLKHIDEWIGARIDNAACYNRMLGDNSDIIVPEVPDYARHSFNYYTVRLRKNRDLVQEHLKKNGIASAIYYPLCLHLQEIYRDLGYHPGDFPIAEKAQDEVLSLPMFPELTGEQIEEITGCLL